MIALSARLFLCLNLVFAGPVVAMGVDGWVDAVQQDRVERIDTMLIDIDDVDTPTQTGKTALMSAARTGDGALVDRLLDLGANVNATNHGGGTPLMYATWYGDPQTVVRLLELGARVDQRSNNGWTALMMAAAKNHAAAARALLQRGANANLPDVYGWTPLMRAAHEGHSDVLQVLLQHASSDLSQRNDQGKTALHLAVIKGHSTPVGLLLAHGAQTNVTDFAGRTPQSIARTLGREDIATLLGQAERVSEKR